MEVHEIEIESTNEVEETIFTANDVDVVISYWWDSHGRLPRQVYLLILFGENTQYLEHAYSDEREPEEKDGQHFVFTW